MPTVFPDQAYVSLEFDYLVGTFQPNVAPFNQVAQVSLSSPTNCTLAAGGEGLNAAGWDQYKALYNQVRVESFTVRATLLTYGSNGLPLQLVAVPIKGKDTAVVFTEDDVLRIESEEMSRSVIVSGTGDANTALVYKSTIPVLEGRPMGQDDKYEFQAADDTRPSTFWKMAIIVYNFANDNTVNPSKIQISVKYNCRFRTRLPIQVTEFDIQDPQPFGRDHTREEEEAYQEARRGRDETMSSAASTISGISAFSQLMTDRAKLKR